jgi:hypothetical protein
VRDYGTIAPRFWIGTTGKRLRGDKDAQILAAYLPTSPHATATGVYHCPILYMAHETGLTLEEASEALRRLIEEGFCEYDEASETVFVINMATHQIGDTVKPKDNRYAWLKKELEKMPKAFKTRFLAIYGVAFNLGEPAETMSPTEAPSEPLPSQDQDQDQDQDKKHNGHSSALPTDVKAVFDHWRQEHKHPKAQLDKKRLKVIRVALKAYTAEQLCHSISGYKRSPHHMGQNDQKTVYDSIELFLRDAEHIDRGLKLAESANPNSWKDDPRYKGSLS